MANVVKHYYEDAWVDISDYVESISEIPTSLRNRDFTLKSERLRLSIASTIRDVRGVDYEFSEDEKFAVYVDDVLKFQGIVENSEYLYRDMTFDIELRHTITLLETVKMDYATLHTEISSGTNWYEYTQPDYYDKSVVGFLWLLKCIFSVAGFTLDTTEIDDEVLFTSRIIDESNESYPLIDITYQDLFMWEVHIWCLGQQEAIDYSIVQDVDKISAKDFLSEVLSRIPIVVIQSDIDSFKLAIHTANYSITDDNKYEYSKRAVKAETSLPYLAVSFDTPVSISNYYNTDINNKYTIPRYTIGGGNISINIMANFYIYFSNAKTLTNKYEDEYFSRRFTPDDGLLHELTSDLIFYEFHDLLYNFTLNLASIEISSKINSLTEEEIETTYQSTVNTVEEHSIDLEWSNSKIKQVTYNE
jgi:hypothetical protein